MSSTTNEAVPDLISLMEKYPAQRGSLIPLLQEAQDALGYLSPEALEHVAAYLGISVNEIYGVATFYTQFRFDPPARHKIQVCQGTACHVRGGQQILDEFEQQLGIQAGGSTEDGLFGLERVACLGCCALAPVVAVDGHVFAGVTAEQVPAILDRYRDNDGGGKE